MSSSESRCRGGGEVLNNLPQRASTLTCPLCRRSLPRPLPDRHRRSSGLSWGVLNSSWQQEELSHPSRSSCRRTSVVLANCQGVLTRVLPVEKCPGLPGPAGLKAAFYWICIRPFGLVPTEAELKVSQSDPSHILDLFGDECSDPEDRGIGSFSSLFYLVMMIRWKVQVQFNRLPNIHPLQPEVLLLNRYGQRLCGHRSSTRWTSPWKKSSDQREALLFTQQDLHQF